MSNTRKQVNEEPSVVTVKLDPVQKRRLRVAAAFDGVPMSDFARDAIERRVSSHERQRKQSQLSAA